MDAALMSDSKASRQGDYETDESKRRLPRLPQWPSLPQQQSQDQDLDFGYRSDMKDTGTCTCKTDSDAWNRSALRLGLMSLQQFDMIEEGVGEDQQHLDESKKKFSSSCIMSLGEGGARSRGGMMAGGHKRRRRRRACCFCCWCCSANKVGYGIRQWTSILLTLCGILISACSLIGVYGEISWTEVKQTECSRSFIQKFGLLAFRNPDIRHDGLCPFPTRDTVAYSSEKCQNTLTESICTTCNQAGEAIVIITGLQVAVATMSLLCLWRRRNHLLEGRQDANFVRHSYMKRIIASTIAAATFSAAGWITWLASCDMVLQDSFSTARGLGFYMSVAASVFCALTFANECGIVRDIIQAAEEQGTRRESSTTQINPSRRLRNVIVRSSVPPPNNNKKIIKTGKNSSKTMKSDDGEASAGPPRDEDDAS
mmetsp:Transcript_25745/g.41360  ORF Transcript_25745/g.41360 Transcript_25745/m.41360 type:complete len:426 (-) Transcript_25745:226-1503(-)